MTALDDELDELERLGRDPGARARVEVLCRVQAGGRSLPVTAIDLGPHLPPDSPVVVYVGGVHGLESIGSKILLAHLSSLRELVAWDAVTAELLERVRVVFVPIVNPSGVLLGRRSNARGVDLMRNAPVDAEDAGPRHLLFRGHRLSRALPWYRGRLGDPVEPELGALLDLVRRIVFPARFAISLDVHSGFFGQDRIWFPYARSRRLFPSVPEALALKDVLDQTYPNHRYRVEPQATEYTTHGDLWDHAYDERRRAGAAGQYLPLTLELSSASWLWKHPRQLLSPRGIFHPVERHRVVRLLRRHAHLLELLLRLAASHERWLPTNRAHRAELEGRAASLWAR